MGKQEHVLGMNSSRTFLFLSGILFCPEHVVADTFATPVALHVCQTRHNNTPDDHVIFLATKCQCLCQSTCIYPPSSSDIKRVHDK